MIRDFKGAGVISVGGKTGRVSAGAYELVKLELTDEVIIFILDIFRIGIAIESG